MKCPFVGIWSYYDAEGNIVEKQMGPEDVLPYLVKGYTISEIVMENEAPFDVVLHAIATIPDMMRWRDLISYGSSPEEAEASILNNPQHILLHQK